MACTRSLACFPGLFVLLLGALTVVRAHPLDARNSVVPRATKNAWDGTSSYDQIGTSGVSAMQMSVVDDRYVIIFDKAEHNPLQTSDGNPAWGALLDTHLHKVRALKLKTNSFCAGGGWLSNGTLIDYGGYPKDTVNNVPDDADGLMGIRLFTPKPNGGGSVWEDPKTIHLTTARWYPSSARLSDGSQLIFGGALTFDFNDESSIDNPTLEFFPPKGNGKPKKSQFLKDAMPSNLFPHMWSLPDNTIFVAANTLAMIYDWVDNTETRLPDLPNGVRVTYPWNAGGILLPLTPENNYTPEILFCGGSTIDDTLSPDQMSSQTPASDQCSRMKLTTDGIAAGWKVETMPGPRLMIDALLMPDGNVLLINGAATGLAAFNAVPDMVGSSNADNPVLTPWLYKPSAAKGKRFVDNFAESEIPRMYHSSASLLPDGSVLVAGSNPNADVTTGQPYSTEYRIEYFRPPYYYMKRPSYTGTPDNVDYGETFTVTVKNPGKATTFKAAIMDLGFHTHAVSLDSKYVGLVSDYDPTTNELTITGPPNSYIYPPGPAWLFILGDGIPSNGTKLMVGSGDNPPSSKKAYEGAMAYSKTHKATDG